MKRIIFTLLLITSFSVCSFAKYSGGTGEPGDPYQIANAADLMTLAHDSNDYNKYFIMTADINIGSYGTFTSAVIAPVSTLPFTGTFDGALHKIYNLKINTGGVRRSYLGLFGSLSGGIIKNLGIENVSIIIDVNDGSYIGGLVGKSDGIIDNCYAKTYIQIGKLLTSAGGLTGNSYGIINNCYSKATIYCGNGSHTIGGLTGSNYAKISNSYSTGFISCSYGSYFGGLTGNNQSTITNCYSACSVSGGIVAIYMGGLVGYNIWGNISFCYSTGSVSSSNGSAIGALVGANKPDDRGKTSIVSNCYFLVSAGPNNGLGTPLTAAQLKQKSNFVTWDFTNIWSIAEGVSYPRLRLLVPLPKYSGGSGTIEDPYQIASIWDLLILRWYDEDYGKYFVLKNDIDLNPNLPGNFIFSSAIIAPDMDNTNGGYDGTSFTGVFDGSRHKIKNLTIITSGNNNNYLSLFGKVSKGEIKNLAIENFLIMNIPGLSIYDAGLAGFFDGNIINCYSIGTIICDWSSGIGGLTGYCSHSNINNCWTAGTITLGNDSDYVGGLTGVLGAYGLGINNCYSLCKIKVGDNSWGIGGLVGYNNGGNINNSYSAGNDTVGINSPENGALVGYNWYQAIGIKNSYFLDISGRDNNLGEPLTDSQMKQQASFAGWDFINIWTIREGLNYPRLAWDNSIQFNLVLDSNWMYQNLPDSFNSYITAEVVNIDDPCNNSSYSYEWSFELPDDVNDEPIALSTPLLGPELITIIARGFHSTNLVSNSGQTFKLIVDVTGDQYGNIGHAEKEFAIALLGDTNNDGVVNIADRSIINAFWRNGSAGKFTLKDCDLNCDGVVNIADRSIANSIWRGVLGSNYIGAPCPLR